MVQTLRRLLAALAVGGILVASLAAAPAEPSAPRVPSLDTSRRAAIDRYVIAEMARQRIPGLALGVYRHGVPIYLRGYGVADLEWGVRVGTDTLMQTGSLGKQFVAAAILRLAEEGKVDLDASVLRYFPEGPASWRPITVARLLSHTSGIGVYDKPELTVPGGVLDARRDYTEDQLVAATAKLPLEFPSGTRWRYNNTNYMLLGVLIHRVTGQFYGDWLHDHLFAPLGMQATRVISDTDVIRHRASGYEIKAGVLRNQQWVSATFNSTADGTLYTTVEDMARWDRALGDDRMVTPAARARLWTPYPLVDGKPNGEGYGFGWWIGATNGHRTIEHGGAWQGFACDLRRFPDDDLTVAVFVNLDAVHARPANISRVVAGLLLPALMPATSQPIADDPARTARLRGCSSGRRRAPTCRTTMIPLRATASIRPRRPTLPRRCRRAGGTRRWCWCARTGLMAGNATAIGSADGATLAS